MKTLRRYSFPYLIWMILFVLVPTLFLVVLAFSDLSLYRLSAFSIRFDNFAIFQESYIITALSNSLIYAF
ncbi:MAG: hypothetical protein U1C51_07925, partial [Candidatus Izemoplasmatales bacterium]|nr:hypothetical protein [Candidatus Izemoplasmatales bacterium]